MMKQMRKSGPKGGMFGNAAGSDQFADMMDQERAKQRQGVQTASKACEELSWELRDVRNSVLDLGVLEGEYVNALKTVQSRYAGLVSSLEDKLRELPPPVGLAFGAYCEASAEVHRLVKVVAAYMVERRGGELGYMDKEQKKAVF